MRRRSSTVSRLRTNEITSSSRIWPARGSSDPGGRKVVRRICARLGVPPRAHQQRLPIVAPTRSPRARRRRARARTLTDGPHEPARGGLDERALVSARERDEAKAVRRVRASRRRLRLRCGVGSAGPRGAALPMVINRPPGRQARTPRRRGGGGGVWFIAPSTPSKRRRRVGGGRGREGGGAGATSRARGLAGRLSRRRGGGGRVGAERTHDPELSVGRQLRQPRGWGNGPGA